MMRKITHNTLFLKVAVVFLAVIIVLCVVYLYSYITSMRLLENEKTQALRNAGISQIQLMDKQISNAKRAIYNAYATQNWNSLAMNTGYLQDYNDLVEVASAEERMRMICDNSEIVNDVLIHFPRWGRSISAVAGLIDYNRSWWEDIKMPQDSVGAQIVYRDDSAYITTRYQMANPQIYSIDAELSFEKSYQSFGDYDMLDVPISNYLLDLSSGKLLLAHEAMGGDDELIRPRVLAIDFFDEKPIDLKIGSKTYRILSASSSYSNLRILNVVRPEDLIRPFARQTQLVILFTILISLSIILVLVFVRHEIVNPINKMIEAFKPVEKGDFSGRLQTSSNDEFSTLFRSFNQMVQNLQVLVNEVYEKELLVQHADLKQLQSQINPHFLYNSLYALSTMIKTADNENADRFCMYLANYFRYITRSGSDLMTLADEWRHASMYLNIMTMRNSNIRIEFQQELPDEAKKIKVPRLIIQPILENAFKHGGKTVTHFILRVTAAFADDQVIITVEDNGIGIRDAEPGDLNNRLNEHQSGQEITGLINIHRRLRLMFGSGSGLSAARSELGGLRITTVIDLRRGGEFEDVSNNGR